ncbi:hypothetical protein V6N13_091434 [Hibiscus sabdariffa]
MKLTRTSAVSPLSKTAEIEEKSMESSEISGRTSPIGEISPPVKLFGAIIGLMGDFVKPCRLLRSSGGPTTKDVSAIEGAATRRRTNEDGSDVALVASQHRVMSDSRHHFYDRLP